ncbi:MAG: hypothetical protein IJZ79_07410 [Bacilli bacterium]|nr:hypothetical protein [Bacilli bacterium]
MNNKYVIKDDKVIVTDGNLKVINNSELVEEILICENSIEIVEERLDELSNVLSEKNTYLKKKNGNMFFSIIIIILTFIISKMIFGMIYGDIELASLELLKDIGFKGIFKNMKISTLGAYFMSGLFMLNFIDLCFEKKNIKNSIKGLISERKYLKETLNSKKNLLEKLNKKIKEEKDVLIIKEIEDTEIKKIQNSFDIQYDCGYYEKKYERYYRNDTLNKKLRKKYSQEEIEQVDKYFEEKKYVKKKVRKK